MFDKLYVQKIVGKCYSYADGKVCKMLIAKFESAKEKVCTLQSSRLKPSAKYIFLYKKVQAYAKSRIYSININSYDIHRDSVTQYAQWIK